MLISVFALESAAAAYVHPVLGRNVRDALQNALNLDAPPTDADLFEEWQVGLAIVRLLHPPGCGGVRGDLLRTDVQISGDVRARVDAEAWCDFSPELAVMHLMFGPVFGRYPDAWRLEIAEAGGHSWARLDLTLGGAQASVIYGTPANAGSVSTCAVHGEALLRLADALHAAEIAPAATSQPSQQGDADPAPTFH